MIDGQKYFKKPIIFWKSPNNFGLEHCVKSVLIRSFSGPYFPTFGQHTERYSVCCPNVGKIRTTETQSECRKIRTTKTLNTVIFQTVELVQGNSYNRNRELHVFSFNLQRKKLSVKLLNSLC